MHPDRTVQFQPDTESFLQMYTGMSGSGDDTANFEPVAAARH